MTVRVMFALPLAPDSEVKITVRFVTLVASERGDHDIGVLDVCLIAGNSGDPQGGRGLIGAVNLNAKRGRGLPAETVWSEIAPMVGP